MITTRRHSTTVTSTSSDGDLESFYDQWTPVQTLDPERLAESQNFHQLAGWFAGHRFGGHCTVLHDHNESETVGHVWNVPTRRVWAVMDSTRGGIVGSVEWDARTLSNGGWSSTDNDSQLDPF